jgi:hypothetical protein
MADLPLLQPEFLSHAMRDVIAERQRQITAEGWDAQHDDEHNTGSMAIAAACYAITDELTAQATKLWRWTGWASQWWKPKDRRRNLVRAGALILAEIERLDRAAGSATGGVPGNQQGLTK